MLMGAANESGQPGFCLAKLTQATQPQFRRSKKKHVDHFCFSLLGIFVPQLDLPVGHRNLISCDKEVKHQQRNISRKTTCGASQPRT